MKILTCDESIQIAEIAEAGGASEWKKKESISKPSSALYKYAQLSQVHCPSQWTLWAVKKFFTEPWYTKLVQYSPFRKLVITKVNRYIAGFANGQKNWS